MFSKTATVAALLLSMTCCYASSYHDFLENRQNDDLFDITEAHDLIPLPDPLKDLTMSFIEGFTTITQTKKGKRSKRIRLTEMDKDAFLKTFKPACKQYIKALRKKRKYDDPLPHWGIYDRIRDRAANRLYYNRATYHLLWFCSCSKKWKLQKAYDWDKEGEPAFLAQSRGAPKKTPVVTDMYKRFVGEPTFPPADAEGWDASASNPRIRYEVAGKPVDYH